MSVVFEEDILCQNVEVFCKTLFYYYICVCVCILTYYGVIFYAVERQISVLFINYKDSVFCIGVMSSSSGEYVSLVLYHFFSIDFQSGPSVHAWPRFKSLTWQGDGPIFSSVPKLVQIHKGCQPDNV